MGVTGVRLASLRAWERDKKTFAHKALVRLAYLNIGVISLLLKCSHRAFHVVCLESSDIRACADQMPKGEKKIQPVAVPLDTLPERRSMTIQDFGSRNTRIAYTSWRWFQVAFGYLSPGTRQWRREKSAPRPYETDPFPTAAQLHLTTSTKISTDI